VDDFEVHAVGRVEPCREVVAREDLGRVLGHVLASGQGSDPPRAGGVDRRLPVALVPRREPVRRSRGGA
jgi:hypothetical protein